jgi:hypothetical protein
MSTQPTSAPGAQPAEVYLRGRSLLVRFMMFNGTPFVASLYRC